MAEEDLGRLVEILLHPKPKRPFSARGSLKRCTSLNFGTNDAVQLRFPRETFQRESSILLPLKSLCTLAKPSDPSSLPSFSLPPFFSSDHLDEWIHGSKRRRGAFLKQAQFHASLLVSFGGGGCERFQDARILSFLEDGWIVISRRGTRNGRSVRGVWCFPPTSNPCMEWFCLILFFLFWNGRRFRRFIDIPFNF